MEDAPAIDRGGLGRLRSVRRFGSACYPSLASGHHTIELLCFSVLTGSRRGAVDTAQNPRKMANTVSVGQSCSITGQIRTSQGGNGVANPAMRRATDGRFLARDGFQ